MKVQFYDRVWRILFIIAFVLGTAWMPATSAQAAALLQAPNPNFEVNARTDEVTARNWAEGTVVSLTINTISYGTATMAPAPWNQDDIVGQFYPEHDIQAGDVVTVEGNGTTKVLTVTPIHITDLNVAANTISGVASEGGEVQVCVNTPTGCYTRDVTASDPGGDWSVDFGTEFTLGPGNNGWVEEWDADGDGSWEDWRILNPRIEARTIDQRVEGYEWPLGATVTLEIDDPATLPDPDHTDTGTVVTADWNPDETYVNFELNGVYDDLKPGDVISLTDGTTIKQHTVTSLTMTGVDPVTDIVTGTAAASSHINIWICNNTGCYNREEDANLAGNWSTDFGDNSQTTFDIVAGTWVDSAQWDEDGDGTLFNWGVPNPRIEARTNGERVEGFEWPVGATVTLEIDDPATLPDPDHTDTGTVVIADWDPNQTYVNFELNGVYDDLKPGDVISLTDGTTTKQHIVTDLMITDIDPATDIVTGTAAAGSHINVWACGDSGCTNREEDADLAGDWSTDFGDSSQPTFDIVPGTWVDSAQWDEDGDGTLSGLNVANPHIVANAQDNWIHAREWDEGTTVTLTINGDTGNSISAVVTDPQPWNPSLFFVEFDLAGYDVQVGDVLTVEGDGVTKELTISPLQVTDIDLTTDTISGTTTPGADVGGGACAPDVDCIDRSTTADGSGAWSLDYHTGIDLVPGSSGWVQEWDGDGDGTEDGWSASIVESITRASTNPTSATSVNFTVTFSESVNNVTADDFGLEVDGTITGQTIGEITGSDATYTVTVNIGPGTGTLKLTVLDTADITNQVGNPLENLPFTGGETYTIASMWYLRGIGSFAYGTDTDIPVPADYNGDGKDDAAIFRESNSTWYIRGVGPFVYGTVGDIPVPADYNGDGKDDIAVFRPSNSTWYIYGVGPRLYGTVGDIPVVADYNGDGKDDIAVFRPTNSTWYIYGVGSRLYGTVGDIPVVADYNGDGKADIAVFRPTNSTWYIYGVGSSVYGTVGDTPVVADYNGDGKADIAVFRPSNSTWYLRGIGPSIYGTVGDTPVVADYNGDGKADIAVFRP